MPKKTDKRIYRIAFHNQGKVYEIYAGSIGQSAMLGFIEVSELKFGEKSALVLDPAEDALRSEFKSVERTFIPLHSIIRIDQVEKQGAAKMRDLPDNVTAFPVPLYTHGGER